MISNLLPGMLADVQIESDADVQALATDVAIKCRKLCVAPGSTDKVKAFLAQVAATLAQLDRIGALR